MSKISRLTVSVAVFLISAQRGRGLAQTPRSISGMATVPIEQRSGLLQKLTQLVRLYRDKDWESVFARLTQIPPINESAVEFGPQNFESVS